MTGEEGVAEFASFEFVERDRPRARLRRDGEEEIGGIGRFWSKLGLGRVEGFKGDEVAFEDVEVGRFVEERFGVGGGSREGEMTAEDLFLRSESDGDFGRVDCAFPSSMSGFFAFFDPLLVKILRFDLPDLAEGAGLGARLLPARGRAEVDLDSMFEIDCPIPPLLLFVFDSA